MQTIEITLLEQKVTLEHFCDYVEMSCFAAFFAPFDGRRRSLDLFIQKDGTGPKFRLILRGFWGRESINSLRGEDETLKGATLKLEQGIWHVVNSLSCYKQVEMPEEERITQQKHQAREAEKFKRLSEPTD